MNTWAKYIRAKRLAPQLAISEPTLWRWLKKDPTFPKPVKLSARVTAWLIADIQTWLDAKKGV
ncbi:MAG: AlpA family phage regulatory protein [Nitrosospira sp.]|nr:AlpA family phage regulatory protein [Nitrosospira sp.]